MKYHIEGGRGWAEAPAKLNVYLQILARRPDGYHDLDSVMVALELADELRLEAIEEPVVELHATWDASLAGLSLPPLPTDRRNLVVRAAELLRERCGVTQGLRIALLKRIPPEAGLGGGSSDAAATLVVANELWNLQLDRETLRQFAGELGSDVPFFLADSAVVRCTGRGEILTPLALPGGWPVVVFRPDFGLSTAEVYRGCRPSIDGSGPERLLETWSSGSISGMARCLRNDLFDAACRLRPELRQLCELSREWPDCGSQMSGSGSACFVLCPQFEQAEQLAQELLLRGLPWVVVTSTRV